MTPEIAVRLTGKAARIAWAIRGAVYAKEGRSLFDCPNDDAGSRRAFAQGFAHQLVSEISQNSGDVAAFVVKHGDADDRNNADWQPIETDFLERAWPSEIPERLIAGILRRRSHAVRIKASRLELSRR